MLSTYTNHTAVYTDGSFVQVSKGSAFICDDQVFSYRLHRFNSVFTAELYAIYRAILFIRRWPQQNYLVCTDSLSALQCLSGYSPDHPIVAEILIQGTHLHKSRKSVVFCWVPGHTGFPLSHLLWHTSWWTAHVMPKPAVSSEWRAIRHAWWRSE
jgi:ribonuclease HI